MMIQMKALLILVMVVLATTQNAEGRIGVSSKIGGVGSCKVQMLFNTTRPRSDAARFFSAYNQVLGMALTNNVTYDNRAIQDSLSMVPTGLLRFPGGTQANYWNFTSANQIVPCSLANASGRAGQYCAEQRNTNLRPPHTFSAGNYFGNISVPHLVGGAQNMVWVFNLLTMGGQELNDALDTLMSQVPHHLIQYIEFGNEYYLKPYKYEFPNATVYMEKALPFAAYIKSKLPHAKISVPAADSSHHGAPTYNEDLVRRWNSSLINYVTFHDYEAGRGFGPYHNKEKYIPEYKLFDLINFGAVQLPTYALLLESSFPQGTKVFISEFDVNPFAFPLAFSRTTLKAQFALNFQTSGFCNPSQFLEMTVLHVLWSSIEQVDATIGLNEQQLSAPTSYSSVAQLLAHVGTLGLKQNDYATCLEFSDVVKNGCGMSRTVKNTSDVPCLTGMSFWSSIDNTTTGNWTQVVFYLSNACVYGHHLELPLLLTTGSGSGGFKQGQRLQVEQWDYPHTHQFHTKEKWTTFENRCEGSLWEARNITDGKAGTASAKRDVCKIVNPKKTSKLHTVRPSNPLLVDVFMVGATVVRVRLD